ncbi:IQ-DOMAIN 14-like [Sarracenia purpurea var. burkii]
MVTSGKQWRNSDARRMGKKGSWFSAIMRVFTSGSKEKPVNGSDKKSTKEKKKGRGVLRHGETKSFIPLFREPSSIEKILGEADQQKLLIRPPTPTERSKTPHLVPLRASSPRVSSPRRSSPRASSARFASPRGAFSPRVASPRAASPRVASPQASSPRVSSPKDASSRAVHQHKEVRYRPEPTLRYHHFSATKIQAAYRGYMARKSFRALRGLVRLHGVVRGQNVKRQTVNAMKMMQLLVRVQTQIQSRRIQMLENQALQRQAHRNDKEVESSLGKWTISQSEAGQHENWDDSVLTKEERDARLQKKLEAIFKRERAMAYAYSNQLWKANSKSAQTSVMDIRSGGFPWWWNWFDRQLLPANPPANPSENQIMKSYHPTPSRPSLEPRPSPSPRPSSGNYTQRNIGFENLDISTPRSTRSAVPVRTKQLHSPSNRTPRGNVSALILKYSKPMKDDDSLTSCPAFSSVPNYMTPTVSAKAKARESSNPGERFPGTPSGDSKRRFSFPLTPNMGSFKWNKRGSSSRDSSSQRVFEKQPSFKSTGNLSIDSTISMPAAVGRKPFNRFV